ncbi:hypothetical protein HDE69_003898 [Pedobacter cryoconitis]|uniref:Secreted protein (Por secretion system target) n=1 Tax=Pedobacter cryoconitis TaxID=188932 RepID=A0A7W8YVY6_9SPHI|nr:hypothetical protein [Pedobacter cryoconitis]MBB5622816.1 hypothetical protein [Pedobacter cryoconitis]MBB5645130.1 hypothetical protein [Pedobacter cryoconitis]
MKNLLKIGLIATILFTSVNTYASNDDLSLKVNSVERKTIRLSINQTQDMKVTFYGLNDEILYEKKGHELSGSSKTYDLTDFPDGNYIMKLETDLKSVEYQINIENNKASLSTAPNKETFKPVLTKKDGVVTLNLDYTNKAPVEITIFDEFNNQLYTNTYNDSAKLVRKFNIGKALSSKLTFVITSKDQAFNSTIDVR